LNARDPSRRIDFEDAGHVFGKVEDDGGVATLSGKGGASTACEHGSAVIAANSNGSENVFFVAWNDDTDRNLAVIGAVGCVQGAAARIEANLSAKVAAQASLKRRGIELRGMSRRWGDVLRHRVQNIFEDAGAARKG
jgi:hypothetical protein